ncbi:hypothetical protein [Colwellia sp. TT2012]|uniref:hypothetical protein n=1 Tax=Colwellia sp. TT2012 TaxID=1720342 RepID=UPI00070AB6E5|nr:hypothetical protein [Colwellia sp. TT2012]
MHLEFYAQEVHYAEALGGDIIQVSFQEYPDPEVDYNKSDFQLPPSVKRIFFSANYEFPPCATHVDWCDGEEEDGGELIKEIELTNRSLKMTLKNNYSFNVSFKTDDITFQKIKCFLTG